MRISTMVYLELNHVCDYCFDLISDLLLRHSLQHWYGCQEVGGGGCSLASVTGQAAICKYSSAPREGERTKAAG
jgi:hypothetical protein